MFFFGSLLLLFFFGLGVAHSLPTKKEDTGCANSGLVVFALCFLTGLVFEKNTQRWNEIFLFVAVGVVGRWRNATRTKNGRCNNDGPIFQGLQTRRPHLESAPSLTI